VRSRIEIRFTFGGARSRAISDRAPHVLLSALLRAGSSVGHMATYTGTVT
jgi:hypothetical protein